MPTAASGAAAVAAVTIAWFFVSFWFIFTLRDRLAARQGVLWLPSACIAFTAGFVGVAAALVTAYRDPSAPLVSPFSARWFSAGWNRDLVFMSVRVDTALAYGLVINYQVTRCILGSLLSNAFQPYVMTLLSQLVGGEHRGFPATWRLLLARAFCDVTGFITYLTDLILYVSQVDIFIVSAVVTILTNSFSTWLVLRTRGDAQKKHEERRILEKLKEPHVQPLFYGARMRL